MKILKATTAAPALLISALAVSAGASAAYAIPTAGAADDDWAVSVVQENEGLPKTDHSGRCGLERQRVVDAQGKFLGYFTMNVCR